MTKCSLGPRQPPSAVEEAEDKVANASSASASTLESEALD